MSVQHSSVTVGVIPESVLGGVQDRTPSESRDVSRSVLLTNEGATAVLLGGEYVQADDYGYKLSPGASATFDLSGSDDLFGVVASGTAVVRALHLGV